MNAQSTIALRTGARMPVLALGTWELTDDTAATVAHAYSPLTRTERLDDARLNEIAARYQRTPAQILIRWNLQLGTVPLPKANRQQHLEENIDVFEFEIADEDMSTLGGLNESYSSLGSLPYS